MRREQDSCNARKPRAMRIAALIALATVIAASAAATLAESPHPVAFWRQIAENKYAVPAGSDLAALTGELTDMLGSPEPELRDDIAYSTLTAWIYQTRVIEPDALRTLVDRLLGNLKAGIGERDN